MFYKDKVVWITGASSGIGEALVYELAKQKAIIVISSNQQDELDRVKLNCDKHKAECFVQFLDVTNSEKIYKVTTEIISKYGRIDVLINNAGISQRALVIETPVEIDRKIMEINYFGSVMITKAVLPYMIKQQSGYIAVTSSISGKFGFPLRSAYSAAKHALHECKLIFLCMHSQKMELRMAKWTKGRVLEFLQKNVQNNILGLLKKIKRKFLSVHQNYLWFIFINFFPDYFIN